MKSLIVAFFIVSAAAAEEFYCTPGSFFQQSCNSCVCSNDGKSAACTDMLCPEENVQKYCQPGQQFQLDDLSTCICSKDGLTAACTLGLQVYDRHRYLTKNSQYCFPGSTFSPDNCNTCLCSKDGSEAVCTLKMCSVEEPKRVCEPLKSFKDYCNTCFCDADGLSYSCTRMACDKNVWNEDGSMKVMVQRSAEKQVCEPLKTFKDYCNTCFCDANGLSYSCTRMYCDKNIWNEDGTSKLMVKSAESRVCTPHSLFKERCNTCVCSEDGLSKVCTMMSCDAFDNEIEDQVCTPRSTFSPDGCNTCKCNEFGTDYVCTFEMCPESMQKSKAVAKSGNWGPLYKQGDLCTPGKTFYSECNQCVCTGDGRNAFCTLMSCHNDA